MRGHRQRSPEKDFTRCGIFEMPEASKVSFEEARMLGRVHAQARGVSVLPVNQGDKAGGDESQKIKMIAYERRGKNRRPAAKKTSQ